MAWYCASQGTDEKGGRNTGDTRKFKCVFQCLCLGILRKNVRSRIDLTEAGFIIFDGSCLYLYPISV